MKTKLNIIPIVIAASLTIMSARAQGTLSFTTSVGNGSLTLNPVNLVYTGDVGNAASYNSTLDSLTFNGLTYTNLDFTVYNNSFISSGRDGFQILVNKDTINGGARLELRVWGSSSVVNGVSTSDLMTVLNSYTALQGGSFSTLALYNNPNPPFDQQIGTVFSFQAVPEPSALALLGISLSALLTFRHRNNNCHANKADNASFKLGER